MKHQQNTSKKPIKHQQNTGKTAVGKAASLSKEKQVKVCRKFLQFYFQGREKNQGKGSELSFQLLCPH